MSEKLCPLAESLNLWQSTFMVVDFTKTVDVRQGAYWESVESIDLNWVRKKIKYIIIPEDVIRKRIRFMAEEITKDYKSSDALVLITVLQGAQKFSSELSYLIDNENVEFDAVRISSYIDDQSTGEGQTTLQLKNDVTDKDILLVEDIIDTGQQMKGFLDRIASTLKPRSVNIATLAQKMEHRQVELDVRYTGFVVPDEFVVGYGLDYNEKYRNLPFVGVLLDKYTH